MATGRKTAVYDKWDGGEFGTMNPSKAPNGTWTGTNVVVYDDGMIGPRPGVRKIATSTTHPVGYLRGLGFSPVGQTDNTPIFFIVSNRVYCFDPAELTTVLASGTLGATPDLTDAEIIISKESVRLIGDEVYFSIDNDQTYRLNCRTQTLTAISGSEQGYEIELYRDRMLVGGGNRIYYSAAADFTSGAAWPVGNFFDVGAAYRIISMLTFRDSLVIFTQSGTWVMTGTADDGTLRRVSDTLAPLDKALTVTNESIVYIPTSRNAPVIFNGSFGDERSLDHLGEWKDTGDSAYGVQSYGNRDVVFVSQDGEMLWRKNEAWSQHQLRTELNLGPFVTRYFDDHIVIATPGTASTRAEFYMLAMNLNRPAFTSDTWARPGDGTDTPLDAEITLPDYLAENGKELRIRSVTVDFFAYNTGASGTNNISLRPTALGQENNDGVTSHSVTGVFNQSVASASTTGTRCRRVYRGTPLGWSSGFRLKLYDLRGVKIERVIIEFDEQDVPVT